MADSPVSSRALVGLFVLVTLGILAWGTLQLGGFSFKRSEGYPLTVTFGSAYGVEPQTPVLIAGIKVGEVIQVELVRKKARITIKFLKGVQIHTDATTSIKTAGIIGEKYLEVDPGSETAPLLLPGQEMANGDEPMDFEKLAEKFSQVSVDVQAITSSLRYALASTDSRESLKETVLSLSRITGQIELAIRENRQDVAAIVDSVRRLTAKLETQAPDVLENYNKVAKDASGFMANVSDAVDEVRPQIAESFKKIDAAVAKLDAVAADLKDITARVNRGEGTVGKLLNDPETANKLNNALDGVNDVLKQVSDLKTSVSYRGEYRFNEVNHDRLIPRNGDPRGGLKSYVGLKIQPKEDKFYYFEIIQDPAGRVSETKTIVRDANGKIISSSRRTKIEERVKFSAEIAKTLYGITLRGGMIENTGGVGADYSIIDPSLRVSVQAFDFSRETNPDLKAELDYVFLRHFFVTAGAEDIINTNYGPLYFGGAGFHYDDDDLKLLLSSIPTP